MLLSRNSPGGTFLEALASEFYVEAFLSANKANSVLTCVVKSLLVSSCLAVTA